LKVAVICGLFLLSTVSAFTLFPSRIPTSQAYSFHNPTILYNVATSLLIESNENGGQKKKLSRPERKALERERKERRRKNANHRKHNFKKRSRILAAEGDPGEGKYDLHSTAIPKLTKDSSADDVLKAIKRAQNLHDAHDLLVIERFLLEEVDESFAYGYRGSILSRLAVAALHVNNHELARKALEERRTKHRESMRPMESAAIIRGLLRVHNVTDAFQVLEDELSLPSTVS
jgi:hypothetical protein